MAEVTESFGKLSLPEREVVLVEIHGAQRGVVEDPKQIAEALEEMRQSLLYLPGPDRSAYEKALFLCPSLATDDAFWLRFLRAERYDPREAAIKFCAHWDQKLELFPRELLPCRITMDDMTEDDLDCFRTGSFHPLPIKDQTGRAMMLFTMKRVNFKHWKNHVRTDSMRLNDRSNLCMISNTFHFYSKCRSDTCTIK